MIEPEFRLFESFEALRSGKISRRDFLSRALAMGVGAPMALMLVNSVTIEAASAQEAAAGRPTFGTDGQVRGAGGELKVRQWIAPENVFAHITEFPISAAQVSSMILEPLLSYASDGSLVATLATDVPTKANGGLSEDLTRVTLHLQEGVLWSDGEPLTAEDVVWTWQWITDETNGAVARDLWSDVLSVEAISPSSVRISYAKPTLKWFAPLAGAYGGAIIPAHVWREGDTAAVNAAFAINPIGTGPYQVEEFVQGDHILCTMNQHYREPNKPYFSSVHFQGGGDSASDAQAVLVTGEGDVAAILFVMPTLLREMEVAGGKGKVFARVQTDVERIMFNFSDPTARSTEKGRACRAPHPILSDRSVREALSLAIDRESLAEEIFQAPDLVPAARNILTGLPAVESPNTAFAFSIDKANALLDDAGWKREGDVRVKDGEELAISFHTMVIDDFNQLMRWRPEYQAAIKVNWEAIGVKVELGQVAGEVFFDISPENEHSYAHFFHDVQMYAWGVSFPLPDSFFFEWYAGSDNENVAQQANDWTGMNTQRYVNPEFDRLYEESIATTDPELANELFIQMNDHIVNEYVAIPLHARSPALFALSNSIAPENVAASAWEPLFWNIANWRTVDGTP